MPPHCDTMDGPVIKAAARALEEREASVVLPYVPKDGEDEVREAFAKAIELRGQGDPARDLADRYFFETVVRIHRAGEGEPYTGLKPAGLDHGPVIPVAERAIETGSAEELEQLLCQAVRERVSSQLDEVMSLRAAADGDVDANRSFVSAMLGFQVWAHKVYECLQSAPHEAHHHSHT